MNSKQAINILEILKDTYPDAKCSLDFSTPFELLGLLFYLLNVLTKGLIKLLLLFLVSLKPPKILLTWI